ncbi:MAG: ABC transporter permease [Rhabdochlamydiaceae bacterium]
MLNDHLFSPLNKKSKRSKEAFFSSYHRSYKFKLTPFGWGGLLFLSLLLLGSWLAPIFCKHNYYETVLSLKNQPPSSLFLFGTDELGRDIFARIWAGARISLFVGLTASFIDLIIGVFYGAISGFKGGKLDQFMMRSIDILNSIPYLLVVILLIVVVGPGLLSIILALSLTGWVNMARMVRAQVLQIKEKEYVKVALANKASFYWILMKHVIPNILPSIIVTLTLSIPSAIFAEAFLSFLGLGVQAPMASWGTMAHDGLSALRYYPWRLFFPASFISITMLCFNLIGDALRDALETRNQI